jgi:hypothetical protein
MKNVILSPSEHDRIVRANALQLLHDGFAVQARLGGWFKAPATIHGYRPDIFAIKDKQQIVVEVTKGSIDWPKTSALQRYSQENPDIEVRIISPEVSSSHVGDAKAAEPKQRFLIAIAKLLGINPTKDSILYEALLCPHWLLDEIIEHILQPDGSVQLNLTRFNQLMVNCRCPLATEHFFQWIFSGINSIDAFEKAVDTYRVYAMWIFGSFKFAYRKFATCSQHELEQLKTKVKERSPEIFQTRSKFNEIAEIAENDLHLLGYLSSAQLDVLFFLDSLAGTTADQNKFHALIETFQPKIKTQLSEALRNRNTSDLQKLRAELQKECNDLFERQEKARDIGRQNTIRYLSIPYLDVYVATSMRNPNDFLNQRRFTHAVFEHESVNSLNLRYFDPTLSYVDDRATKGLIECLMLQRASVTLYNAGDSDTMGKDSELAATLAQGKPVIVYVPEGDAKLDKRADTFRLDHPLGLQIDHDTGVAHGILVARTPIRCAELLRSILLNTLDLRIRHESGLYLLEEHTTGSILRVITDDALLTHTFWTYFRHQQGIDEKEE